MHQKHQNSTLQRQTLGESAFDSEKEHSGTQVQAPPSLSFEGDSMQLTADPTVATPVGTGPLQLQEPSIRGKDKKKAEYGPEMKGPIAEKGWGDAHAIDRSDVNQGSIGDCWLLASLMALADTNPGLLENAIDGPKDDGTYDVTLYKKKGIFKKSFEAQTVNVSSSFVVSQDTGGEYYARGGDVDAEGNTEMWVRLIEKAYAKMKGGYNKIDGGFEENALETLTGKEHSSHGFNGFLGMGKTSTEDLKKAIMAALDAGKPVTASTKFNFQVKKADKKEGDFGKDNDIVGLHPYSVVKATDTHITVRNPWGRAAATEEPELTWEQFRSYFKDYTTQD